MDNPGLPIRRTGVNASRETIGAETGAVPSTSVQSGDDAGAIIQRIEMIEFKSLSWTVYDSDGHAHPGPSTQPMSTSSWSAISTGLRVIACVLVTR